MLHSTYRDNKWNGSTPLTFIATLSFPSLWSYVRTIVHSPDFGYSHRLTSYNGILADVVQFFAMPIVLAEGWLPLLVANTLYAVAGSWYWYITHLGYRALPFLSHTEVFLFPITLFAMLHLTMLVGYPLGFGWNLARFMARFYFIPTF
jgi:UNC-50 family